MLRPVAQRCLPAQQQFVRRATTVAANSSQQRPISLQNIETTWQTLSQAERDAVVKHLEELQTQDWKSLSAGEKKAACNNSYIV